MLDTKPRRQVPSRGWRKSPNPRTTRLISRAMRGTMRAFLPISSIRAVSPEEAMNRKALIVEDGRATGELLIEILRRKNFDATLLLDAKPAVPSVYANQPDLILLDLMLPALYGYSLCQELHLA